MFTLNIVVVKYKTCSVLMFILSRKINTRKPKVQFSLVFLHMYIVLMCILCVMIQSQIKSAYKLKFHEALVLIEKLFPL